jgi:hypothetical protein
MRLAELSTHRPACQSAIGALYQASIDYVLLLTATGLARSVEGVAEYEFQVRSSGPPSPGR